MQRSILFILAASIIAVTYLDALVIITYDYVFAHVEPPVLVVTFLTGAVPLAAGILGVHIGQNVFSSGVAVTQNQKTSGDGVAATQARRFTGN